MSRGGDAKAIGQAHQRGQQFSGIGRRCVEGVVGKKIGGTALLKEFAQAIEVADERALVAGFSDPGAQNFKRSVEKNDGCGMSGEKFAIGRLKKSSPAQSKDRGPRQMREDTFKVIMLDGAESALATGGKQVGNGSVRAADLDIEVDERAAKFARQQVAECTLACPHESNEDQQRRWRIDRHWGIVAGASFKLALALGCGLTHLVPKIMAASGSRPWEIESGRARGPGFAVFGQPDQALEGSPHVSGLHQTFQLEPFFNAVPNLWTGLQHGNQ